MNRMPVARSSAPAETGGTQQQPAEMRRTDRDGVLSEVVGQPGQRPARQRDPLSVGTGTGHRGDPLALLVGDPAGTPAPIVRVQRRHPALVELVDDAAYMTLVGLEFPRFRGHLTVGPSGLTERMSIDAQDPAVFAGVQA